MFHPMNFLMDVCMDVPSNEFLDGCMSIWMDQNIDLCMDVGIDGCYECGLTFIFHFFGLFLGPSQVLASHLRP